MEESCRESQDSTQVVALIKKTGCNAGCESRIAKYVERSDRGLFKALGQALGLKKKKNN
jgi:hypothetical protein